MDNTKCQASLDVSPLKYSIADPSTHLRERSDYKQLRSQFTRRDRPGVQIVRRRSDVPGPNSPVPAPIKGCCSLSCGFTAQPHVAAPHIRSSSKSLCKLKHPNVAEGWTLPLDQIPSPSGSSRTPELLDRAQCLSVLLQQTSPLLDAWFDLQRQPVPRWCSDAPSTINSQRLSLCSVG